MDEKDVRILYTALEEKTTSPDRIAAATGIPKSTVHYRLASLREQDIIKNDLFDVDADKLGLSMRVISEVRATYSEDYHEEVGSQLAAIEGVNQVYFTMGDTDFVVVATIRSQDMLESLVSAYESIDAVERTSSKFVISTVKESEHPILDFDLETLLHGI
ncbi:MAG: Lrp/AsnC family transcriptional regulator [Halobacteriota archaeon]